MRERPAGRWPLMWSRSQQWTRPAKLPVAPTTPAEWVPPVHDKPVYRRPVRCWLYVNLGWDPDNGYRSERLIYIGESLHPNQRQDEHAVRDPWGDTMTRTVVAGFGPGDEPYVIEHVAGLPPVPAWVVEVVRDQVAACKADVYVLEELAVLRYRPPYNGEYNYANPERITKVGQVAARAARDAARGLLLEQTWAYQEEQRLAADDDGGVGLAGAGWRWRLAAARSRWRGLPSPVRRAAVWVGGWAVIAVVGWWVLARVFHGAGWRLGGLSGVACALLLLWWRWRRRRLRWWPKVLLGVSRLALGALGVWLLVGPVMSR